MPVSSVPTWTREQVQEFLLASGYDPARIAEALAHPHGIRLTVPGIGDVALIRMGAVYEIVENPQFENDRAKAMVQKESHAMKKLTPTLLVGPALILGQGRRGGQHRSTMDRR